MSKTSNPQKRRRSSQNRPIFVPNLAAGGAGVDLVSGVAPATSISGTRYGIVNGVVTAFEVNQPALEDDGFRGCPAFTQYFLNNEVPVTQSITLAAGSYCLWIDGSGSATFNGLTATVDNPKVFNLATSFTGSCVISGTVTKCMLNSGLFKAPFSPIQGTIKSFVAETGSATNGTSFDLDNTLIARIKNILRGIASGSNLWAGNITLGTGWSDDGINYVSAGGNEYWSVSATGINIPLQTIEISFRTGDTASGNLRIYVNGTGYQINSVQPDTVYTVRDLGSGSVREINITSRVFVGKIIKSSINVRPVSSEAHIELKFKSAISADWLSNGQTVNLLSSANSTETFLATRKGSDGSTGIRIYDGVNFTSVAAAITVGAELNILIDTGTYLGQQKMRITVNGVKSSLVPFLGGFGSQDLKFFFGNTVHAGWIKKDSFKIYDRPRW